MQTVLWIFRVVIFLFLLFFAVKNGEPVSVNFFFDTVQAPLVLMLIGFFVVGVVFGLLAVAGNLFALRREVSRLKQALKKQEGVKPENTHELTKLQ